MPRSRRKSSRLKKPGFLRWNYTNEIYSAEVTAAKKQQVREPMFLFCDMQVPSVALIQHPIGSPDRSMIPRWVMKSTYREGSGDRYFQANFNLRRSRPFDELGLMVSTGLAEILSRLSSPIASHIGTLLLDEDIHRIFFECSVSPDKKMIDA